MSKIIFTLLISLFSSQLIAQETRCGWLVFSSKTWWALADKDTLWDIISQNDSNAKDEALKDFVLDDESWSHLPVFSKENWAKGNKKLNYQPHGCACLTVETAGIGTANILKIYDSKVLPLKQCRRDKNLMREGDFFPEYD